MSTSAFCSPSLLTSTTPKLCQPALAAHTILYYAIALTHGNLSGQPSHGVPQELVDAIINKVARLDDARRALEACSLTARSLLPQGQRHLFAAITCRLHSSDLIEFAALLAESPHIGELYVRYFTLKLERRVFSESRKQILASRVLRLLPGLTHLALDFDCTGEFGASEPLLQSNLHTTLSLHCLRSLCLTNLHFCNIADLEWLLSHAAGLKELILDRISFDDPSAYPFRRDNVPYESRVVLESLTLDSMRAAVDVMVSSFSTVDIKHLQSLVVASTPIFALLKANVQTLQKVRIVDSDDRPFDIGILEGNQTLHHIEVVDIEHDLASSLQLFGPLSHLKALKTIFLHVWNGSWHIVEWTKLNTILAGAGDGMENVYLSACSESDLAFVTQQLPAVAGKISHKNDAFSHHYTFGPQM
ncbi:hypothetical protein C8J57DRAFT_1465741 [Mycena rebaudengoi]|nr:hypothetical protein C8J57DRAFT_1465741 [Mycena rebaudengoi]